jgi:transcriptional regulator with XRE-family HTH domain
MRLKDIREDLDITQQQVAEYLHVKQNTYSQYENGHRQLSPDILIRLALYFQTSADYILGLTDERRPYPRAIDMMVSPKRG